MMASQDGSRRCQVCLALVRHTRKYSIYVDVCSQCIDDMEMFF